MQQGIVIVNIVAVAMAVAVAGCGEKASIQTLDHNITGDRVAVEGVVALRGSMPVPDVVVETDGGETVQIEPGSLQLELQSLAGMRVVVEGELKRQTSRTPRVEAVRYQLLRLESGEIPLIGVVSVEDGECILAAEDHQRYWIRGDLSAIIRDYDGARIWVVGASGDTGKSVNAAREYWPTGYGVLAQRAPRTDGTDVE